jgi:hypothetical protein
MEIFGIIGLILISIAIWQKEKRQDELFVIGGLTLLIYSYSLHNVIFIILQIVFILSAIIELLKRKRK